MIVDMVVLSNGSDGPILPRTSETNHVCKCKCKSKSLFYALLLYVHHSVMFSPRKGHVHMTRHDTLLGKLFLLLRRRTVLSGGQARQTLVTGLEKQDEVGSPKTWYAVRRTCCCVAL